MYLLFQLHTHYISFLDEPCEHGTQTGVCYGRNDIVPKGLIITDTLCDSTEPECFCFVQEEEPESCTGKYQQFCNCTFHLILLIFNRFPL